MPSPPPHRTLPGTAALAPLVVAVLGLLALLATGLPAAAGIDVTTDRVAGPERAATAAAIAGQAFPDGTTTAVLATAIAPADALTATALAGALDAALLLVYPDRVPDVTADALADLGVTDLVLVGGPQSISPEVEDGLGERYALTRIAGVTQYDTAAAVSREVSVRAGLPLVDGRRTVLLADGEGFADALAGSVAGFAGPTPVLYAERDALPAATRDFLATEAVEQVVVLGGPATISEGVEAEIEADGRPVVRLGGADRTETATLVATWTARTFGFPGNAVLLARGDDFPDALTAGQLAGRTGRPLLLSATPTVLPAGVAGWLAERCDVLELVQAVGGEAAVATTVLDQAAAAASCAGGDPAEDPAVADITMTPLTASFPLSSVDTVTATDLDGSTTLDAVLFPCEAVRLDADGSAVFADGDGDGAADGYGSTSAGTSVITGIDGGDVDDGVAVRGVQPDGDRLGVDVSAYDDDCAVVVVLAGAATAALAVDEGGRPTVAYGAARVVFGAGIAPGTAGPTYRVDPQEPAQSAPGEPQLLTVAGRLDGAQITEALDLVLFPCEGVEVLGAGPDTFADADGDGGADGFGTSDTGSARITSVNSQPIEPDTVVGGVTPLEDAIELEVTAAAADCVTVVVVDGNGNGKLDLDGAGTPVEPYGVSRVTVA